MQAVLRCTGFAGGNCSSECIFSHPVFAEAVGFTYTTTTFVPAPTRSQFTPFPPPPSLLRDSSSSTAYPCSPPSYIPWAYEGHLHVVVVHLTPERVKVPVQRMF